MLSENGLPPMYYFYSLNPQKTLHGSHVFHSTNFEVFISIYFQFKKKEENLTCMRLFMLAEKPNHSGENTTGTSHRKTPGSCKNPEASGCEALTTEPLRHH